MNNASVQINVHLNIAKPQASSSGILFLVFKTKFELLYFSVSFIEFLLMFLNSCFKLLDGFDVTDN